MSLSVTVLIPAYNRAAYLGETLDSVLASDHDAFDVLVLDDGSTDETPDILADLATVGDTGHDISRFQLARFS